MHDEARAFVVEALSTYDFAGKYVLEIGSLNVNSEGFRPLAAGAAGYFGIDIVEGPGVDRVVAAQDYDGRHAYDLVICTEVLEHVFDPDQIVEAAWRALKPGGVLVLTAASERRKPHSAYGGEHPGADEWYRGITEDELRQYLWNNDFGLAHIAGNDSPGDVYAVARVREDT